jgi:hypothetical protein
VNGFSEVARRSSSLLLRYLTTLSVARYVASNGWMIESNDLERIWQEVVVA